MAKVERTQTLEFPLYRPNHKLKGSVPIPENLKRLSVGEAVPPDCGVIRVMTSEAGDERFAWNPHSLTEIAEARKFFNDCVAQGLVPYKVGTGGKASSQVMKEFDLTAGEVIFLPVAAVAGGERP